MRYHRGTIKKAVHCNANQFQSRLFFGICPGLLSGKNPDLQIQILIEYNNGTAGRISYPTVKAESSILPVFIRIKFFFRLYS